MKKLLLILVIGILVLAYSLNGFKIATLSFDGAYTKGSGGETFVFEGCDEDIKALLTKLNATIIQTQNVGGAEVIYAHSPRLRGGVIAGGEKINMQIAKRGSVVTVGVPVIAGSF